MQKLRLQPQISIRQAAVLLHTVTPLLSRKERGEDEIDQMDIWLAIATYHLSQQRADRSELVRS